MKEVMETLFKNELDQWPHQFMHPAGFGIFMTPMIAGFIMDGIIGALIFGAPFITIMLLQRFMPI